MTAFLFHLCSDTSYDESEIDRWNVVSTTEAFSVPRVAVEPPAMKLQPFLQKIM